MNSLKLIVVCLTVALMLKITLSVIKGVEKHKEKKLAKTEIKK